MARTGVATCSEDETADASSAPEVKSADGMDDSTDSEDDRPAASIAGAEETGSKTVALVTIAIGRFVVTGVG